MANRAIWLDKIPSKSQLSNKLLKNYVDRIAEGGGGNHSAAGDTLLLTIKRLEEAGVSYQLTAHPGYGYYLQGLPKEDWMKND